MTQNKLLAIEKPIKPYFLNLIGKKVIHLNDHTFEMEIIKLHGKIVTCLLPKDKWYYIFSNILMNIKICSIDNLIIIN